MDKFRVPIPSLWKETWPQYWANFVDYCNNRARYTGVVVEKIINQELKPLGGKLIKTSTQGWYLRWDKEENHTFFVLRWQ
jgi:cyclophilin family peptidyl-prolyl cis-trans isomerase